MKSTTRFSKNKRGIECLNCKQPLSGKDNFCSNCGQVNDLQPLSIKQFITEFFSGFFSFDTRFFKTFVPLIFKPGKVSKEYIEGKRKKYVNPVQLYLNVTIVFFLLTGLISIVEEYALSDDISIQSDSTSKANTTTEKLTLEDLKEKVSLRMDSVFTQTNFLDNFKTDSLSEENKDSIYNTFQKSNNAIIAESLDKNYIGWNNAITLQEYIDIYKETIFEKNNILYNPPSGNKITITDLDFKQIFGEEIVAKTNAFIDYDNRHKNATATQAMIDLNYKKTRWNAFYFKTAQNINKAKADNEFLRSWGKKIVSQISIALFFLLPIFTLFLSLLYIRRKWNYTEHLVFVFNVQTAFFLLLIFFTLFDWVFDTGYGIGLFVLLFLFYLYKALRNFYGQRRFKTIVKFMLLNLFYFVLSLVGLVLVSFIAFVL